LPQFSEEVEEIMDEERELIASLDQEMLDVESTLGEGFQQVVKSATLQNSNFQLQNRDTTSISDLGHNIKVSPLPSGLEGKTLTVEVLAV
jgi:hypothetical protein